MSTEATRPPSFQDRIARILQEIRGVRGQYNITDWEWQRLNEWREQGIAWGSERQRGVLDKIETKVFRQKEDDNDDG